MLGRRCRISILVSLWLEGILPVHVNVIGLLLCQPDQGTTEARHYQFCHFLAQFLGQHLQAR